MAAACVVASSGPALVLGWLAIAYPVMGWGAVLAVLGISAMWLVPRRSDEVTVPAHLLRTEVPVA